MYVGTVGGIHSKRMLRQMLLEALEFGLVIFGKGWENMEEFAGNYKGVLEPHLLSAVYSSSLAVLGATMDAQRDYGMINNRVRGRRNMPENGPPTNASSQTVP